MAIFGLGSFIPFLALPCFIYRRFIFFISDYISPYFEFSYFYHFVQFLFPIYIFVYIFGIIMEGFWFSTKLYLLLIRVHTDSSIPVARSSMPLDLFYFC